MATLSSITSLELRLAFQGRYMYVVYNHYKRYSVELLLDEPIFERDEIIRFRVGALLQGSSRMSSKSMIPQFTSVPSVLIHNNTTSSSEDKPNTR